MKKVIITNPHTILSQLLVAAKSETCQEWERLQEDLTSGMSLRQEDRVMSFVGRRFGMNPIQYDNEPYGVFIDNIWREAKKYSIEFRH